MNIFYVNTDPVLAAKDLADQHITKMGIESAQMLSTAHWMTGSEAPYKKTHYNHPSSVWARESLQNYRWLATHALEILNEYERRYGRIHKTKQVVEWLINNEPSIPDSQFSHPPECMPDEYKLADPVSSYRNFYIQDKLKEKKLSYNRSNQIPNWIK